MMGELMRRAKSPHEAPAQSALWEKLQAANAVRADQPVTVKAGDLFHALQLLDEAQVELDRLDVEGRAMMPPGVWWAIWRVPGNAPERVVVLLERGSLSDIFRPGKKTVCVTHTGMLDRLEPIPATTRLSISCAEEGGCTNVAELVEEPSGRFDLSGLMGWAMMAGECGGPDFFCPFHNPDNDAPDTEHF